MSYRPNGPVRGRPAPVPDTMRTDTPRCSRCGQEIHFLRMESGRLMPCDKRQRYGDGTRHLVVRMAGPGGVLLGRLLPRAGEEDLGFEPHFGTCPALLAERARKAEGRAWAERVLKAIRP